MTEMGFARAIACLALLTLVNLIGVGHASSAVRVVGGTAAPIQAVPWTVFVAYNFGPQEYVCTGSVIDPTHIVTAAHCLYDPAGNLAPPSSLSVEAGVSNFVSPTPTDQEQLRAVASFRIHPGYVHPASGAVAADDVAVLALSVPLDLSGPAVRAVALPDPDGAFPAGASITVAGFGLEDATAHYASGALESMTGTVDAQGDCGENTVNQFVLVNNAVIVCATSPTSALCNGDSGSGVVTAGPTPTLLGVADGSTCAPASHAISTYVGAAEILRFIEGDDQPPTAPRPSLQSSPITFTWERPLVPGATLTCSPGTWATSSVGVAYSFINAATGHVFQSGPQPTYVVSRDAVGTTISCVAAVTNGGGTTVVTSLPTPAVSPAPRLKIKPPAPSLGARGRATTVRFLLVGPPGLSGRITVCIVPPTPIAARVCRLADQPIGASGTLPFAVRLPIKPTAPLGTTTIAITATVGTATAKSTALLRITRP